MKQLRISILPLLFAAFLFEGCATDIVGKAEQITSIADINFHTFLTFERANETQLLAINPAIHKTATKLRHKECATCDQNVIAWEISAREMTETYRLSRTPDNKFKMDTAIALIQKTLDQITQYFLDPKVAALSPSAAAVYRKK